MKAEATIQIAQVSLQNGQATEETREAALRGACDEAVTNLEFLRGRLYIQANGNDVAQALAWQREEDDEFGDYYYNASALQIIRGLLAKGDEVTGLEQADRLRNFIIRRGDEKSKVCLLPEIDFVIAPYWR